MQSQHHKTTQIRRDNQTDIDDRNGWYVKGQPLHEDSRDDNQSCALTYLFRGAHASKKEIILLPEHSHRNHYALFYTM